MLGPEIQDKFQSLLEVGAASGPVDEHAGAHVVLSAVEGASAEDREEILRQALVMGYRSLEREGEVLARLLADYFEDGPTIYVGDDAAAMRLMDDLAYARSVRAGLVRPVGEAFDTGLEGRA